MISEIHNLKQIEIGLNFYSIDILLKIYFELSNIKKIRNKKNLVHFILLHPPGLIRKAIEKVFNQNFSKKNVFYKMTVYYVETPILKAFVTVEDRDGASDLFVVKILSLNNASGYKIGDLIKIDKRFIYNLKDKILNTKVIFTESSDPLKYKNGKVIGIPSSNKGFEIEVCEQVNQNGNTYSRDILLPIKRVCLI